MIESEKGDSCVLKMASSKTAHSLIGTKGLGSNASQFEQTGNLITIKMNPPDSAKVCKKLSGNNVQNSSPVKVTVAPSVALKKVVPEPVNGSPAAALVVSTKEVNNCGIVLSTTTDCKAVANSGNKGEQVKDQKNESSSSCSSSVPNSVQNNCSQPENKNDEKHKWPSEENMSPHQNSVLQTIAKLKSAKLKLPSPSSGSSSKEDLDDVSIDLTEEEEDMLLGKKDLSDTEPEVQGAATAGNAQETGADGVDHIYSSDWKVLDETEASTCSSDHSSHTSTGVSPRAVAISPKIVKPDNVSHDKKEQTDFTRLCNNISSKITKLGGLSSLTSKAHSDSSKVSDNVQTANSVKQNCGANSSPSQDSSIKKNNSQTEKRNISIKENLFDKIAKEKLVPAKVSDFAFVPEDDESDEEKDVKLKSSLWNFSDGATNESNQPKKSLNISFFDNSATEDGMQLAVDKVVQKILTEISDDSDTNEASNADSTKSSKKNSTRLKKDTPETENTLVREREETSTTNSTEIAQSVDALKAENRLPPKPGDVEVPKTALSTQRGEDAEVPKVDGTELPKGEGADLQNTQDAKILKGEGAEVPKSEEAEVPQAKSAENASVPMAEDADVPMAEDADVPMAEDADVPTAKDADIPAAEDADIPAAEDADVPAAEDADVPAAEDADVPAAEDADVPAVEDADVPAAEDADVPAAEDVNIPKAQDADVPAVDNCESPKKAEISKPEGTVAELEHHKEANGIEPDLSNDKNGLVKDTSIVAEEEKTNEVKPLVTRNLIADVTSTESGPSSKRAISPDKNENICDKKLKTKDIECSCPSDSVKKEEASLLDLSSVLEIKTAAQIAKDKTEFDLKRKWNVEDETPTDRLGLTVKKVKIDSDSVREDAKLALVQHQVEPKAEPVSSDAIKENKCKESIKMTKQELDDYIAKRINLFVTQDEKSDIGVLKLKCEYLEKSVDKWKKKASIMQKQITEMHIALQRAIHVRKTTPVAAAKIQVPTRSVGLQVQLNSLHQLPDKQLPRHISGPPAGATVRMIPASSAGHGVLFNKGSAASVTNLSKPTPTPTLQSMIAKPPLISTTIAARPLYGHATTTVSAVQIPSMSPNTGRSNISMLSSIAPRPSLTYTNAKPTTSCVSILQPRITNSQPMTGPVVVTSMQPTAVSTNSFPKVASVIPPSSTTVRAILDSRRMQVGGDDGASQENVNPSPKDEKCHLSGDEEPSVTDAENALPRIEANSNVLSSVLPVVGGDGDDDNDGSKKEIPLALKSSKNCLLYNRELPFGKDVQQNSHTQNMTKAALRILRRFLSKYSEAREINEIPPSDLDKYLACFFSTAKKKDNADYGPHTLTCIFDSIDRFLRVCRYPASIKKDEVFYMTRENLRAKRKHLRKVIASKKRLAQALEQPSKFEVSRQVLSPKRVKERSDDFPSSSKRLSSRHSDNLREVDKETLRRQPHSDEQSLQSILSKLSKCDSGIQIIKVEGGKSSSALSFPKSGYDKVETTPISCGVSDWCSEEGNDNGASSPTPPYESAVSDQRGVEDTKPSFIGCISSAWNYTMADCVVHFFKWLSDSALGEHRTLSDIPPLELDAHIVKYMTMNESGNGSERLKELRTFWDNLSLHLALCNYSASIKADPRFPKSQSFMASVKKMAISSQMPSLARDKLSTENYKDFEANLKVDTTCPSQQVDISASAGEVVVSDIQLFTSWIRRFHNVDNQPIFLLDPGKLDTYLARFFTSFEKEDGKGKLTADELKWLRDSIDGYLHRHKYPSSIKMGYEFQHSIECFRQRHSLLLEKNHFGDRSCDEKRKIKNDTQDVGINDVHKEQSHRDNQYSACEDDSYLTLNEKSGFLEKRTKYPADTKYQSSPVSKLGNSDSGVSTSEAADQCYNQTQSEGYTNALSYNSAYPDEDGDASDEDVLTALLEPDISLIEDDDEIVINASDDCILDSSSFLANQTVDSVGLFSHFLTAPWINEKRELLSLPPPDLDRYLALFFVSLKQKGEQEYDVEGLLAIQKTLNDFLLQNKYGISILDDAAFEHCRMCLVAKCESVQYGKPEKLLGLNVTDHKLTAEEVELLCKYNVIGYNCPISILTTLVAYFMTRFGLRSIGDQAGMTWGDIDVVSNNVNEMLVSHKHCSLQEFLQSSSSMMLDSYAVKAYRKYKHVRCAELLTEDSKFFVFASSSSGPHVWFSDKPLRDKHIQRLQEYLQRVLVSLKLRRAESERMLMYGELMAEFTLDDRDFSCDFSRLDIESTHEPVGVQSSLEYTRSQSCSMPVLRATLNKKPMVKSDTDHDSKPQVRKNENPSHSLLISRLAARVANEHSSRGSDISVNENRDLMYASRSRDDRLKEIFAAEGHAPNTIIKTLHDVNVFKEWLVSNQEFRDMYVLPPTQLAQYLLQFFTNLKKRDGTDYEPNSLYSIYFSIDRYLKVNKYPGNIKTDATFQDCRKLFQERRREFDTERLRDALHMRRQVDFTFSEDDIQLLRSQQLLGSWNPDAMLLALWHTNTVLLGIHSQKAHLHMLWGDVELLKTPEGHEYLEYHQHATKAKLATCPINSVLALIPIAKRPSKVFALPNKPAECPVELYKQFRLRRPLYTLTADSRFYLCPNQDPQSGVWFRSIPMGRSRLASIPATIWNLIRKVKGVGYGHDPAAPSMGMLHLRAHLEMKPQLDLFHGMNLPPMNILLPSNNVTNTASLPVSTQTNSKESPSISLIPLFTPRPRVMPGSEESHSANVCSIAESVTLAPQNVGQQKNILNLPGCFSSVNVVPSQNVVLYPLAASNNASSFGAPISSQGSNVVQIIPLLSPQPQQSCIPAPALQLSSYCIPKPL